MDWQELDRLIRIRSLLEDQGIADPRTRLFLFCSNGFSWELQQRARRGEAELIDLARLYEGE